MQYQIKFPVYLFRTFLVSVLCLLSQWFSLEAAAKPVTIPEPPPPNKGVVLEEKDLEVREQLAVMVDRILKDPDVNKKIVETGEERTIFCRVCHGEDGNATRKWVPNLAGQQATYVIKMLKEFRSYSGRRFNPWMTAVTTTLTDEEIADVAAYISTIK